MAKVLEMPKLSPTMEEGVLSAWHKKEGDDVAVDDLLAEVETDKATMEFRAFDKGTILKLLVEAGAQVKLGQPVAIVGEPGRTSRSSLALRPAPATAPGPAPAPAAAPAPAPASEPEPEPEGRPAETLAPRSADPSGRPRARPHRLSRRGAGRGRRARACRRVAPRAAAQALNLGVDLRGAKGSGPGGRVVLEDLESLRAPAAPLARMAPAPVAARADLEAPEARPLSPMRKTIARRLTEAKATVPHFYLTIDVDAAELVKLREEINAELAAAGHGDAPAPKVSLNDLLIKACAVALVAVPECNASFTPEAILVHRRVDISVAVAIPEGLVTPVVRHADKKSLVAVASEVRDLAARARARKLRPEEMTDGTFSISNLGMFGIDQFAAVINPPEGAILAVGQVRDAPVVRDGAVAPGKRLGMTLSCDHRVVDGAVGAAFLAELRRLIERPLRVLIG